MNFLKILFWIVLTAVVVVFSINNWTPVTLNLWGGLQADIKLPVLALFFFFIGWLPTFIYLRTKSWRMTRRVETLDREVSDLRGLQQFRKPEAAKTETPHGEKPPAPPLVLERQEAASERPTASKPDNPETSS